MFHFRTQNNSVSAKEAADLIKESKHFYAITGAGISTSVGIPDLEHLGFSGGSLSSESSLERNPQRFYRGFHRIFIDPIFNNGPSPAHKILAKWEEKGLLSGIITTNVDYLHELAGNKKVPDIWRNLNVNYCIKCGHTFGIDILKAPVPRCPLCGGLISPDPVYHDIATSEEAEIQANNWVKQADLIITIGSNGYYPYTGGAEIIDVNPEEDSFAREGQVHLKERADEALLALDQELAD